MRKSISIFAVLLVGTLGGRFASATSTCNGVSNNLVANCSFQTGDFTSWSGTTTTDLFSGVDQGDPNALPGSQTPFGGQPDEAFLGSFTPSTLTQTLTTVAGDQYTIAFALLNDTASGGAASGPNSFEAEFGTDILLSETNTPVDGYTLSTFIVDATSASTDLTFTSENNTGDFELDSISVAQTPEPGSFLLLGTALLGLAGLVSRRMIA